MVTNRRRITAGLLAMGLGASIGLTPVVASARPGPSSPRHDGVELLAHMHSTDAYRHARGFAKYELDFGRRGENGGPGNGLRSNSREDRSNHVRREFSIELWGLKKAHGKRLVVKVDGDFVGKMTVSRDGTAQLERRHDLPSIRSGDSVRVRTQGGTLVSFGTLHKVHQRNGGFDRMVVR